MEAVVCLGCGAENSEFNAFCEECSAPLSLSGLGLAGERRPIEGARGLEQGSLVAHYAVEGRIGSGSMGEVYRATDTRLGRTVALKVLSGELLGDPRAGRRMRREARAASRLSHPAIATIYDVGEHEGRPFIAMALYEGETLASLISRGPLPVTLAVSIGVELAAALATAHRAGIVHRDVKPANVMVTATSSVKLVDFGLAKVEARDTTALTRHGSILGTVAYMAPEQLTGEVVDHRADLWSLGVLLYEALSGHLPFSGSGMAHRILADDPRPFRRDGVPRRLSRLIHALLEKSPHRRPRDAEEVERRLRAIQRPAAPSHRASLTSAAALGVACATWFGWQHFQRRALLTPTPPVMTIVESRAVPSPPSSAPQERVQPAEPPDPVPAPAGEHRARPASPMPKRHVQQVQKPLEHPEAASPQAVRSLFDRRD
jgi:serine/threonine protein kinase